jgi:hypothetical protein
MTKPTTMMEAPDVATIARQLISEHHRHLLDAHLLYLFTRKPRSKAGKTVLGTAQKASGITEYLSTRPGQDGDLHAADFILVFSYQEWKDLTESQRRALVDHELTHCDFKEDKWGTITWKIRGHDVEEFREIIQRHGLWQPEVESFVRAAEQMTLPLERVPASGARASE